MMGFNLMIAGFVGGLGLFMLGMGVFYLRYFLKHIEADAAKAALTKA